MNTVTITVEGPAGSGKTALCQLIGDTLQAYGIKVSIDKPIRQDLRQHLVLYTVVSSIKGQTKVHLVEKDNKGSL